MWFFSELEGELGIPESTLFIDACHNGIQIVSGWKQPGNEFMGYGVTDKVGDAMIKAREDER